MRGIDADNAVLDLILRVTVSLRVEGIVLVREVEHPKVSSSADAGRSRFNVALDQGTVDFPLE
jgi:hypothetical protein